MKESGVGAFARRALWVAFAAVGLSVSAGSLHAQSTGKLEGRIRDQAGAPIAGAQVRVDGTAFGAVANGQGYWFLNNVPAGSVDLTATFVGYKPVRVTGLRVLPGQTITQDFALEQEVVNIGDIEVIGAVNALVPRDAVTTKQNIDGDYGRDLPIDQIAGLIALQPGVVASPNGGQISIRGGRTDEAVTYVDGVPVSPGNRTAGFVGVTAGTLGVSVSSFEDATVTTGGSSAEFGNAQSGVIAIQTRSGGSRYSGNFGYETDAPGGVNHSVGFNRIGASFGGPIVHNLSFYLSGDIQGQKSAEQGLDAFKVPLFASAGLEGFVNVPTSATSTTANVSQVGINKFAIYRGECSSAKGSANSDIASNYGFKCQGTRVPASAQSSHRVQGKLSYTFGTGSRIALTGLRSVGQGRNFNYGNLYNPQALTGSWANNNVVTLNWTQNLSKSADRALALETYVSYQWDRAITGPLTRSGEEDTRDPFGGFMIKRLDFLYDFDNFNIVNIDQNFRVNQGRRTPLDLENQSQYQLVDNYRNNAYGVQGFSEDGGPTGRLSLYKEDRAVGKANLDWQFDRYNRLKLGGEYTKHYINSYSSALTSQAFADAYHERPTRWNAFIEDRLDLGDVVLVGGLRYDWYKSNASRPFGTDSLGNRTYFPRISSYSGFNSSWLDTLYVADKSHNYLSPHVQVAFPVTERTNFRFSYAHQVQTPDFSLILGGINTDLSTTNTNHIYGSDLDFGRTITFEFGVRHSFSDDMVLDVSLYNKDKLADAAGRLVSFYDPQTKRNADIRVVTNADFGNARGIDIRFDRRIGELFNGAIAYTYEQAKNTGSDPFTYINFGSRVLNALAGGNAPPPQAALPTNTSRPHNVAGQMSVNFPNNWHQGSVVGSIFENVGIFTTFRYSSGTPYTRCPAEDQGNESVISGGVCSRGRLASDYNGARLPAFKDLNLRITKGFSLGRFDVTAYADIRNPLNFKNILSVFTTTGDVVNATERTVNFTGDSSAWAAEANQNGVRNGFGDLDLSVFGNATNQLTACEAWVDQGGAPAGPNCVYILRAEERFGNGDHIFTLGEQQRASDAFYNTFRGLDNFTGVPRRIRVGFEVSF